MAGVVVRVSLYQPFPYGVILIDVIALPFATIVPVDRSNLALSIPVIFLPSLIETSDTSSAFAKILAVYSVKVDPILNCILCL